MSTYVRYRQQKQCGESGDEQGQAKGSEGRRRETARGSHRDPAAAGGSEQQRR